MNSKEFLQYSSNMSILFIEDDDKVRDQFSEILKLFFHRVDTAVDGLSGLHNFREFYFDTDNYYDIVISEVNLPLMGIERLIKEIKLINTEQSFVVVSDCSNSESLINFIKLGVKDFLKKPLCANELQESLYQLTKSLCLAKTPQKSYDSIIEETQVPKSISFLRCDDSICLSEFL